MPFGYKAAQEALSGGLQGLTGNISQMLMGDYMRKREEQEEIRKEERAWAQRQKELELVFQNNEKLMESKARLDAELEANKSDPYLMDLNKRIMSNQATPEEMSVFEGIAEVMESQSQLNPLSEEQLDFIDQIRPQYPTIAIGLYDQELKRAKLAKEIDVDLQRINAMYGGAGARAERTHRNKQHDQARKKVEDLNKQIFSVKEKLFKEEAEAQKWYEKEDETRVKIPKEEPEKAVTNKRKLRKYDIPIEEPKTMSGKTPLNADQIRLYRKQLKDLERQHEIAIKGMERELDVKSGKEVNPAEEIVNEIIREGIPDEVKEAMEKHNLTLEEAIEEYVKYRLKTKK